MKITILPREQTITVDGETLAFAFPQDPNVLSIRWDGDNGYIERVNGKRLDAQWANVQPYLDLFSAEAARVPTADERWAKIKALRDELTDNGGCLVSGKWFHSDAKSKQQQMALAMVGAALPATPWKTMDGSFVTLDPSIVGQIFQAQMAREQGIFAHAEVLKADPLADINTGWPARYGA
jgi:hypothetical protein